MQGRGVTLPPWVIDWANKILPWAIMGITVTAITLYTDNIGNQRDISRNTWRNDQQDIRLDKLEARLDRIDAAISGIQDNNSEFHKEAISRLDKLVEERERRRK
jgi:hypothetical protein